MKPEEINAVEAVNYYQPKKEAGADQPESTEQLDVNRQQDAYKVELSDAAVEQREFIEAERENARRENEEGGTYNASAKIGG